MKSRKVALSAIVLCHSSAGCLFAAVQAKTFFGSTASLIHPRQRRWPSTAADTTDAITDAMSSVSLSNNDRLQYKRNEYVSILELLRLRGGGSDGDEEGGGKRRRRRRKQGSSASAEATATNESEDDKEPSADDEAAKNESVELEPKLAEKESNETKKGGKKRRRRLPRVFGRGGRDDTSNINDEPEPKNGAEEIVGGSETSLATPPSDAAGDDEKITSADGEAKKERRKKRRRTNENAEEVLVDPADDQDEITVTTDPVEEIVQDVSQEQEDDTPEFSIDGIKKKRRKRRVKQNDSTDEVSPSEEVQDEQTPKESSVDEQSGITGGESAPQDAETSEGSAKKRKRRKRNKTVADTEEEEESLSSQINDNEPQPTIAIDASIEIPNEEVVPESIGTSVVIEDSISIDQLGEGAATESTEAWEEEEAESSSLSGKKKRRRRRTRNDADDSSATVQNDDIDTESATELSASTIEINTSIEIPNEEVVPESIGASAVEIDENFPISLIEDEEEEGLEVEPTSAEVTAADDEHGTEVETAEIEKVEELLDENEDVDSKIMVAADLSTSSIEIEANIEIPNEEVVPESIGASIEVEQVLPIEPMTEDERGTPASGVDIIAPEQDNTDNVGDEAEINHQNVENVNMDGAFETFESSISIDASIELPREEIVPESIGADVEIEESIDIEPIEVDSIESEVSTFNMAFSNGEEDTKKTDIPMKAEEDAQSEEEQDEATPVAEDAEEGASEAARSLLVEEDAGQITDGEVKEDKAAPEGGCDANDEVLVDDQTNEDCVVDNNEEVQDEADAVDPMIGSDDVHKDEGEATDGAVQDNISTELRSGDGGSIAEDSVTVEGSEVIQQDTGGETTPPVVHGDAIQTNEMTTNASEALESEQFDDDCLTASVVTWNLAESAPSEKEASFFRTFCKDGKGIGSDLVMIGAQECEEIKPRRTEGHRSRHIRRMGIMMLGKEYVPLVFHSIGGIQCALYCHRDVLEEVEMINIADVTCGIGNVLHNKGAIGVYLKLKRRDEKTGITKSSRMLFVTAHLAAHVKNVDARNGDFKRIISELEAQAPARFLRPRRNRDGSPAECDGSHLLSSMDHVIFSGDLNYRVDLPREYAERCITDIKQCAGEDSQVSTLMNKLLHRDQLLQTMASGRAFADFHEGKITFLPTFKFDKGTSDYDTSHKQRVPAWTDRILFRSSKARVLEYQSATDATHSDHRPVFGTFQLGWGLTEKTKPAGFARKPKRRSRRKKD